MAALRTFFRDKAGLLAPVVAVPLALSLAAGVLRLLELVGR